jgi:hypothetical protein
MYTNKPMISFYRISLRKSLASVNLGWTGALQQAQEAVLLDSGFVRFLDVPEAKLL